MGGTPTGTATDLIGEIEGMDRDRYAGPVGWMDAAGDGEWGIALRSASISGSTVRLFAGCGIVADSDPEAELGRGAGEVRPGAGRAHHGLRLRTGWLRGDVIRPGRPSRQPA